MELWEMFFRFLSNLGFWVIDVRNTFPSTFPTDSLEKVWLFNKCWISTMPNTEQSLKVWKDCLAVIVQGTPPHSTNIKGKESCFPRKKKEKEAALSYEIPAGVFQWGTYDLSLILWAPVWQPALSSPRHGRRSEMLCVCPGDGHRLQGLSAAFSMFQREYFLL